MSTSNETRPAPPKDAQRLEAGEIIEDGDLHWNTTVKRWVAVTPQGEERVDPAHVGFYYRRNAEL